MNKRRAAAIFIMAISGPYRYYAGQESRDGG